MKLSDLRESLEKHFTSYLEARIVFEVHVDKIQSIVNTIMLMESEPDKMKPQLKEKIKDLLEKGQSYAFKVGNLFNFLTNWSLTLTPEIKGIIVGTVTDAALTLYRGNPGTSL